MTYSIAPLFCRPWTLNGISARLIESHYENNYGSAVRRLNALTARSLHSTRPRWRLKRCAGSSAMSPRC